VCHKHTIDRVRGKGEMQLVDVIALVRHAIDPGTLPE
jgi:hypothetical protein